MVWATRKTVRALVLWLSMIADAVSINVGETLSGDAGRRRVGSRIGATQRGRPEVVAARSVPGI